MPLYEKIVHNTQFLGRILVWKLFLLLNDHFYFLMIRQNVRKWGRLEPLVQPVLQRIWGVDGISVSNGSELWNLKLK